MRAQLLRFADQSGINLLPDPIDKIAETYCQRGNLIHLESGSIISDSFPEINNMIYIKSYMVSAGGLEFNSFLCIPRLDSTNIAYIPIAEFSQNFAKINMTFKERDQRIIMDLLKEIHGQPAITLSKYKLN